MSSSILGYHLSIVNAIINWSIQPITKLTTHVMLLRNMAIILRHMSDISCLNLTMNSKIPHHIHTL